jgi:hypothetical protein
VSLYKAPARGQVAQVAQLVEHCTENAGVGGSIPPLGTTSRVQPEKSDGWVPKVIHVGKRTLNMDHFCSIFVPAIRAMALSASILRRAAFV